MRLIKAILLVFTVHLSHANVIGFLDGVALNDSSVKVSGWACKRKSTTPVKVNIYIGGNINNGLLVKTITAKNRNETGVNRACQTQKSPHRFSTNIAIKDLHKFRGQKVYAYATTGSQTKILKRSGTKVIPDFKTKVIGEINDTRINSQGDFEITGWACQERIDQKIGLHIYLGDNSSKGKFYKSYRTNLNVSHDIQKKCFTSKNTQVNFQIIIPSFEAKKHTHKSIYIHGISPIKTGNPLLGNSGKYKIPKFEEKQERILGEVTKVRRFFNGFTVEGWSCHSQVNESNSVHIYARNEDGKTFVTSTKSNINHSNPEISNICGTQNTPHKFKVTINNKTMMKKNILNSELLVYGIKRNKNIHNKLISNTKNYSFPKRVLVRFSDLVKGSDQDVMVMNSQEAVMYRNYDLRQLSIHGHLRCTTGKSNISLKTTGIIIHGMDSKFECGNSQRAFRGKLNILLKSGKELHHHSEMMGHSHSMGERAIAVMMGGQFHANGNVGSPSWGVLSKTVNPGDSIIHIDGNVNLSSGDEIAIGSSSFNFKEAEHRIVTSVHQSKNETVIEVDKPFSYRHIGEVQKFDTPRGEEEIDFRSHIAFLTRNITIASDGDNKSLDEEKIGGHMMVMEGGKAFIDSVRFERMGQLGIMGRYPFHWHRARNVKGQYIKNSSITNSYQRCVTIHASSHALVENNVCFNHFGHGFFLEEGHEMNNTITGNLGMLSKAPPSDRALLNSDFMSKQKVRFAAPSTFWISNPSNTVTGNVATSYEGSGFWMAFDRSMTCDFKTNMCRVPNKALGDKANYYPSRLPTIDFSNNKAYSGLIGFSWDGAPSGKLTNNPNNSLDRETVSSHYHGYKTDEPKFIPEFSNLTTYKNINAGVYYRGTTAEFKNFKAADNGVSLFVAYNQKFINSLVVGHSKFISDSEKDYQIKRSNWRHGHNGVLHYKKMKGFLTYDGPAELQSVHFAGFPEERISKYGFDLTPAAIHLFGGSTHYTHKVKDLSFEGKPYHKIYFKRDRLDGWMDEINHTRILDIDGSLLGHARKLIVPNTPILKDEDCIEAPLKTGALICDYDLGVFWFRNSFNLDNKVTNKVNFTATRDDGETYGPLQDGYNYNTKLGVIMKKYDYSIDLDRTDLSQVRFIFEHEKKNIYSPIITLEHTKRCEVNILNRGRLKKLQNINQLKRSTESAYIKGYNGDIKLKMKTEISVPSNKSAYRTKNFVLDCLD